MEALTYEAIYDEGNWTYKRPAIFKDGRWIIVRRHREGKTPYVVKHAHKGGYVTVNDDCCIACIDRVPATLKGFLILMNWER